LAPIKLKPLQASKGPGVRPTSRNSKGAWRNKRKDGTKGEEKGTQGKKLIIQKKNQPSPTKKHRRKGQKTHEMNQVVGVGSPLVKTVIGLQKGGEPEEPQQGSECKREKERRGQKSVARLREKAKAQSRMRIRVLNRLDALDRIDQ